MGRKPDGSGPREKLVAFRLNAEEVAERDSNMARRGLSDVSAYYRTLQQEDSDE